MMSGAMDSMMGWMMGIGLPGWVLVIALLVTIVFMVVRLISPEDRGNARSASSSKSGTTSSRR